MFVNLCMFVCVFVFYFYSLNQRWGAESSGRKLCATWGHRCVASVTSVCWGFAVLHTLVDSLVSSYGMCRHMSFVLPSHVCLADMYGEFQSTHLSLSTKHIQTRPSSINPSINLSIKHCAQRSAVQRSDGGLPRAMHVSAGWRLVVERYAASTAATTHWARGAN